MNAPEHLIVALTLPGQDRPIVCAPHGSGGLLGPRDLERFQIRIRQTNEGGDADCLIHLTRHALGSIAAKVSLVGASATDVNPVQLALFLERSRVDRAAAEHRQNLGILSLEDALALVSNLSFTASQLRLFGQVAHLTMKPGAR